MNNNTRNEFASYGLEILKRSVLLVLYEASDRRSRGLLRIRISERLGIHDPGGWTTANTGLIGGILGHLEEDGYAENLGNERWRITEAGVRFIGG